MSYIYILEAGKFAYCTGQSITSCPPEFENTPVHKDTPQVTTANVWRLGYKSARSQQEELERKRFARLYKHPTERCWPLAS